MEQIITVLELGLIYGIMALGVYITYTILDFPDLSVDGTFPLGIAVCTVMLRNGQNPWLALVLAMLAGAVAGMFTGFLHVKLKIRNLLCGILTMTALYSVNYNIVGKASETLNINVGTIFSQTNTLFGGVLGGFNKLVVILVIAAAAKLALDWYLRTKSGFLLRSVGDNEGLVVTLGKNPGSVKIVGLAVSNALVALSGALYCQYIRSFNVGSGTGTVVMGLAAVIIGTAALKKLKFIGITTTVIIGMILYKACIQVALIIGIPSADNNLIITILFILTLVLNEFKPGKKKKVISAEVK